MVAFLKAEATRKISGFFPTCSETGRDLFSGRNEGGSSDRDLRGGGTTFGLRDRAR